MTFPYRLHYLASSFVPNTDASSVHVVRMAAALATQTATVNLFCKAGGQEDIASFYGLTQPLEVRAVPFAHRADLLRYLRELTTAPTPDVVVGRYAYGSLWMAARAVPTVYEVHAPATGIKRWTEARLFSRPSFLGLVSITEALAQHYLAQYPMLAGRIVVLPDAANDPQVVEPVRQVGPLVAAYAGGFYPGRGIELILALARRLPTITFRLAGGDGGMLAAQGLAVPDNVQCVGVLPPAAVDSFLQTADILLAPYGTRVLANHGAALDTTRWCSPMKLFEYMSHGKAILCSDLPVLREVLRHEGNALLLPPEQPDDWCHAIKRLDQDRQRAAQLGAAARADFLARYTWAARAGRLLEFVASRLASAEQTGDSSIK